MRVLGIDPASYLAALVDGEGDISHHIGSYSRRVAITNTDTSILAVAEACLDELDIVWSKVVARRSEVNPNHLDCYRIYITGRANLERFAKLVPIQSAVKQQRLADLLASYIYGSSLSSVEGEKECTACGKTRPLAEFSERSDRPGQHKSRCRMCISMYFQTYWARKKAS